MTVHRCGGIRHTRWLPPYPEAPEGVNEPAGEDQESSGDEQDISKLPDAGVFGIGHDASIIGGSDKECKQEAAPSRIYEVG